MTKEEKLGQIQWFENHYNYPSEFLREMLEHLPKGYETYEGFLPMASFHEQVPMDALFVCKLTTLMEEDCGECLQLNVKMALEAEVSPQIIKSTLAGGDELSDELQDVMNYTKAIVRDKFIREDLLEKITIQYGKTALAEFGLAIAAKRVFSSIKRAMGYGKSCKLISIEV